MAVLSKNQSGPKRTFCAIWMMLFFWLMSGRAFAKTGEPANGTDVFFSLPEAKILEKGLTRAEWNYTFLRGNHPDRIFNLDQSLIATRSNHRKTHLVTWRLKHAISNRLQPEFEVVYKAFRQHTHGDGDIHDRNDDGDFERLFSGVSYQALREPDGFGDIKLRAGFLIPRRAETENVGQESGFDLLAASSKKFGDLELAASIGFAMTFDNRDHPSDPVFDKTPISKPHDLRTLVYGLGLAQRINASWQANLELSGRANDAIQLNRRVHRSELTITPGMVHHTTHPRWDGWLGIGFPIGLSDDADHLGVSVLTGANF